jgi:HSP20 family protein
MRALTPWTGVSTFRTELDRLFDRFWEMPDLPALGEWKPALDITENKDSVVVKAEVPGIDPKEIQVLLQDDVLTIKGEKKQEKEDKTKNYHRVERSYGSFQRSFTLPSSVKNDKIDALFSNGILTITLPKSEEAKPKQIEVKVR